MIPTVKANGVEIPVIGLGTWDMRGAAVVRAVQAALDAGYRHIDTAAIYGNEDEVGEAIAAHATPRDDIFVTTKVWHTELAGGRLQTSAEESLKRLRMDQLDLLLIHWPSRDIPLAEQISALCDAKKRGLTRHVGVSNFPPRYLEAAVKLADEPLVTNQVEHHPRLDQSELFGLCRKHGMAMTSYAPIGRARIVDEPAIGEVAAAKDKTPAQVVLRWHIDQPMNVAIPKSANPGRIAENLDIFDFTLTPDEMARLSGLARPDGRIVGAISGVDWNGAPD